MKTRLNQGFTLIEILVVVAIIGILMTTIATTFLGRADRAKYDLAGSQVTQLEAALEMYKIDNGRYPTQDQGLAALVTKPTGEPVPRRWLPYAKAKQIKDPWRNPFQYRVPGEHNPHSFDIWSFGSDGKSGGEGVDADIGNWHEGGEGT